MLDWCAFALYVLKMVRMDKALLVVGFLLFPFFTFGSEFNKMWSAGTIIQYWPKVQEASISFAANSIQWKSSNPTRQQKLFYEFGFNYRTLCILHFPQWEFERYFCLVIFYKLVTFCILYLLIWNFEFQLSLPEIFFTLY